MSNGSGIAAAKISTTVTSGGAKRERRIKSEQNRYLSQSLRKYIVA